MDADRRSIVTCAMRDSVFRILRLDPAVNGFGAWVAEPVRARWGGNSWILPQTPGGLARLDRGVRQGFRQEKTIVGAEVSIFDGEHPGSARLATTSTNAA